MNTFLVGLQEVKKFRVDLHPFSHRDELGTTVG
jgi:hypothetical protein